MSSAHLTPALDSTRTIKSYVWYKWRSVIAAVSLLTCLSIGLLSTPWVEEGSWLALSFNTAGWMCFLAGVGMRLWATLYIGGRKGKTVIDEGPYSLCRNPLYIGTFLAIFAQVLFLKSGIFAAGLAIPMLIYAFGVIPAEEDYLTRKYGDDYLRYRERVPRWLPVGKFNSPPVIELSLNGLHAECLRIAGWIWMPLLVLALAAMRMQPWWPHLFNLP